MKFLLPLPLFLLLASCSSIVYKEPVSGSRARVRFVSDLNAVSVLRVYDDADCTANETEWMRLKNGYLLNSSPKKLGMPLWNYHDNAAKEVYVGTDKQLNALIKGDEQSGDYIYSCAVPFFYRFSENEDYEVYFHWSRTDCTVTISQFSTTPTGTEANKKEVFTNKPSTRNAGCMSAFKKGRLY